jgi:hypothetical protein
MREAETARRATRGCSRRPRIGITGSAGVGKTALGLRLGKALGVPYLAEGMRARLEGGLDLHALGRDGLRALVETLADEMVNAVVAAENADGGFVSDRCPLDCAAFWLYYGFGHDASATATLFDSAASALLEHYDLVVILPWGALPLAADGVRTANPWLQLHYQVLVEGLLHRWLPIGRLAKLPPTVSDLDARVAWVQRRWQRCRRSKEAVHLRRE